MKKSLGKTHVDVVIDTGSESPVCIKRNVVLTQKVHQSVAPHQVQEVAVSLGSRIEIKHRARIGRVADELYKSVQIKSETTAIIRA